MHLKKEKKEFDEKGKTAALLLRLCKPIFATGKVVILDSGFCVLAAIISLTQFGVFASAMIKTKILAKGRSLRGYHISL